jgi:hypothetical protein
MFGQQKFYFRNSTHNDSASKLQLQKLDRDEQADYGSIGPQNTAEWSAIWPVHPGSLAPTPSLA